jgi:hypothetical protein
VLGVAVRVPVVQLCRVQHFRHGAHYAIRAVFLSASLSASLLMVASLSASLVMAASLLMAASLSASLLMVASLSSPIS